MIEELEVDGVPAVFTERPGPVMAGLTFRVGQADETLARRGVTHLVEHLALHRLGLTDYHSNGSTGSTLTSFYLEGSEDEVVTFLDGVCRSLGELPLDRLARERSIMETEEDGRRLPVMPMWRYGAQGYGLPSYAEMGLAALRPDEVAAWSRRWFTRENAVAWFAGARVPVGLKLALPAGTRRPVATATSALDSTPAWFAGGRGEVLLDAIVARSAAASAYATVLGRELFRALREDGGYSYTANADYSPRDNEFATVTAFADAHREKEDAVVGGFIDVMAKLRAGRVEEADVASARKIAAERFAHPELAVRILPGYAGEILIQGRPDDVDQLREEAAAVTAADVHAVAVEAHKTALLRVPEGRRADWAGYASAPVTSKDAVQGTRYSGINQSEVELVLGADGVSVRDGSDVLTVRYAACAARLDWPDGRRVFIGLDGIGVTVEPTLFALDGPGLAALENGVDPRLAIPRPARDAEYIPRPPAAVEKPAKPPKAKKASSAGGTFPAWQQWSLKGLGVVLLLWIAIAISATVDSIQNSSAPESDWGTTVTLWIMGAFWLVPILWLRRKPRGRG